MASSLHTATLSSQSHTMMNCSFLKAAALAVVVAVLATTAGAASDSSAAPDLPTGFLSSTPLLWIAANVIIFWLFSSFRHHRTAGAGAAASDSNADEVSAAVVDGLYRSAEHDVFAAEAVELVPDAVVAAPAVLKRQTREARTARRPAADRPRVRKKLAGEETPRAVAPEAKRLDGEEEEKPRAVAAEASNKPDGDGDGDDESMESAWQSILQRGAARPVAVRKSETWGGEALPRVRRAADTAVARREMRKSATMVPPSPPHPSAGAPVAAKQGWRTRDVLVMAQDELLRRAESFIRRQHEHLRLQRQESEQRQAIEHQRHHRPAPIRV